MSSDSEKSAKAKKNRKANQKNKVSSRKSIANAITLRSVKMTVPPDGKEVTYKGKLLDFIQRREQELIVEKIIIDWPKFLKQEREEFNRRIFLAEVRYAKKDEFEFLKVLGSGSYGDVLMAIKKEDNNFYAIKIINKAVLIKKKHIRYAKTEQNVLKSIRFPFTIHLEYFFQTPKNLYFVLPLVLGNDLFSRLKLMTRVSEMVAKFYLAQVTLALEYLHYLGLIYRDLKPENTMIDINGYLKLTDFGLSKFLKDGRTYTTCGTPEYMAPEVIEPTGYGISADWWSFGVLAYEMCAGYTPFYAKGSTRLLQNITKCVYVTPFHFGIQFKDFLAHFLTKDLTRRYGYARSGVEHIKGHKWFNGTNWNAIVNREAKPPFKPSASMQVENVKKYVDIQEPDGHIKMDRYEAIFKEF